MKFTIMKTETTKNIGDVFQCIAAMQFIESSTSYLDREKLNMYNGEKSKIIMNGWYIHDSKYWPPSDKLFPLLTSIHISNVKQKNGQVPIKEMILSNKKKYLEDKIVGCRDMFTYKYLTKKGFNAYFSGCMTLTIDNKAFGKKEDDGYICIVDCSDNVYSYIKNKTNRKIIRLNHEGEQWFLPYNDRIQKAKELLKLYNRAHMVISGRLHVILPCLAIETPVLRIEQKFGDERYEGIGDLVYSCTENELITEKYPLNIENLPDNPNEYRILRNNLIDIVKNYINDKSMNEIFYKKIHNENCNAIYIAKKRQIKFRKQNKMTSYKIRKILYAIKIFIRNFYNHV